MKLTLGPVMLGTPVPFRGEEMSAIAKRPASGPVAVGPLGLAGDQQGDKIHHGGVEMAVHHYPHDHYAIWREELDNHELLAAPGAFGENISTDGLTEDSVWIGDRFRLGSALVEVSQGRQPCWKIDHKFQRKGITARVLQTVRCGWYYRVLEPGTVAEGDDFELVERGHEGWDVARVFRAMFYKTAPIEELVGAAHLTALTQNWREWVLARAVEQKKKGEA